MAQLYGDITLTRLPVLIDRVRHGGLQVPAFQRGFVWSDQQRVDLLDSIYQMFPIGSLLIWRTSKHPHLQRASMIGPFVVDGPDDGQSRNYIFDGLQRLTTLYCAFTRPSVGDIEESDGTIWSICCDVDGDTLDAPVRFLIPNRHPTPHPTQFPLWKLFENDEFDLVRQGLAGTKFGLQRLRAVETRFRDYLIPLVPLLTDDMATLMQAFVRVNTGGTRLSSQDMVRALSLGSEVSHDEMLQDIRTELGSSPWRLLSDRDLLAIIKALLDSDLYGGDPRVLVERLTGPNQELLDELPAIILKAGSILAGWGVGGPRALPYIYLFAGLCRALRGRPSAPDVQEIEHLRRWFFSSAYARELSGKTSAQIYRVLDEAGSPGGSSPADATVGPVTKLDPRSVRGRLALLSMARAGGGDLPRRLGEDGSEAVLSIRSSTSRLAERIIATAEERARLRDLLSRRGALPRAGDGELLRRHLFVDSGQMGIPAVSEAELFNARQVRLDAAEREFVLGLGLEWGESPPR